MPPPPFPHKHNLPLQWGGQCPPAATTESSGVSRGEGWNSANLTFDIVCDELRSLLAKSLYYFAFRTFVFPFLLEIKVMSCSWCIVRGSKINKKDWSSLGSHSLRLFWWTWWDCSRRRSWIFFTSVVVVLYRSQTASKRIIKLYDSTCRSGSQEVS